MTRRKPLPTFVAVGRITSPHGWRGAVRVEPHTDFPERFRELRTVHVALPAGRRELEIQEVKGQGRFLLVKFVEINSLEEAEALRGAWVEIPRGATRPLPADHYYVYELIDLPVYTEEGAFLGYVEEVLRTGSNDVYLVRDQEQGKEILLPATKEVVRSVDLEKGEIRVRLLPGLGE